ncbi:hypothetical protein [Gordonia sp. (in: high G+C Gram-positive bacteria)]|uniref:hypothetical protein n=1 Tax=Gordonia sp. (in: high G+C Gram-positive bacteria) TaxID=84139 RepID=UPI003C75E2A4
MTSPTPFTFVTVEEFESLWRPMKGEEETSWAQLLLVAASAWILERKPGIDVDNPAAKTVVTSVVKAALLPGDWQGYRSWTRTVDDATTAAVLANPSAHLDFDAAGAFSLLGISLNPLPVANFARDDWGPP